jgi:hypothetical protein
VTGPVHWKKWIAVLGRCGRRDEMTNKIIIINIYRLTARNLTKRDKRIYKKVSNV